MCILFSDVFMIYMFYTLRVTPAVGDMSLVLACHKAHPSLVLLVCLPVFCFNVYFIFRYFNVLYVQSHTSSWCSVLGLSTIYLFYHFSICFNVYVIFMNIFYAFICMLDNCVKKIEK